MDATREVRRVQHHIAGAEVLAQSGRVRRGPVATLNRHLLLDELRRYCALGRFPKNRDFRGRAVPYFVDADGTQCAVGHLMAVSGHGDLVEHIRRTNNFGKVRELARLAEVRAWVRAAGLTLGEAARIQPSYCFYSQAEACFCNEGSATTAVLATVLQSEDATVTLRVDRVAGAPAELRVGDELTLGGESGTVGEQWLIGREGDAGPYYRKGQSFLSIEDNQVLCDFSTETASRPISKATLLEAVVAKDVDTCVEVLANDDSDWNRSQCEGQPDEPAEPEPQSEAEAESKSASGASCAYAGSPVPGAADFTSAALLAALVLYRRRRRCT